ncbi:O-antigen polymerase [uncultured Adlercreutzia sp.]|uniref:O-antigen polymerase n=1 Tax=uncultured Adlercreutzia sp. TaxID=875803 RepID=UPI0025FFB212|nr:O-antigen polymerase [uncultured Adlercreutzia sp.]
MLVLYLAICGLVGVCSFRLSGRVLCPPVVYSLLWLFGYVAALMAFGWPTVSNVNYSLFALSAVAFALGYFACFRDQDKGTMASGNNDRKTFGPLLIAALVVSLLIAASFLSKAVAANALSGSVWTTIRHALAAGDISLSSMEEYGVQFICVLFLVSFYLAVRSNDLKNICFAILCSIPLAIVFLFSHRGLWFMELIAITAIWIYVKRPWNGTIVRVAALCVLVIGTIFVVSTFSKFGEVAFEDPVDFVVHYAKLYFAASFEAFSRWLDTEPALLMGDNILRFPMVVLNALGFDFMDRGLIQDYIDIGDGLQTNVYTVLRFYVEDFGILYGLLIQGALGFVYGALDSSVLRSNCSAPATLIILCLMYYPLINSFFDDKFFSITSSWIQMLFWSFVLTRNLFIVSDPGIPAARGCGEEEALS